MSIDVVDEQIRLYAKQLKIPAFAEYGDVIRQADHSLSLSGLLLELMKAECEARQENRNRRRLKAAGFPYRKTLDEFDYTQLNHTVSREFIQKLATCQFISNRQNIVMIGNPGRGKTHLSIALGLKAQDTRSSSKMQLHCQQNSVKQKTTTVRESQSAPLRKLIC